VPFVPGVEAAGSVRELGAGVTDFAVGDRVTWVYAYGTYAEQIALPAAAQAHRDLESRATTGTLLLLP
jgi:NADPH:quinone reductase-like Zn-dependent oxidoreductase